MNKNTKRIREIAGKGVGAVLKEEGFQRNGANYWRRSGDAIHVVHIQLGVGNTAKEGRFLLNVGVHFPEVAVMLDGEDRMSEPPKEYFCMMRTQAFLLMPERRGPWWTVTAETDGEAMREEVEAVCANYVLPWFAAHTKLAEVEWRPWQELAMSPLAEAAACLVLGEREKAGRCVEKWIEVLRSGKAGGSEEWKVEMVATARKWAEEKGIVVG